MARDLLSTLELLQIRTIMTIHELLPIYQLYTATSIHSETILFTKHRLPPAIKTKERSVVKLLQSRREAEMIQTHPFRLLSLVHANSLCE